MDECFCDFDPPVFYHKEDVERAREAHVCYDCSRVILPGESYERVRALWERGDGPQTIHTCAWCVELREWLAANVPCYCYLHGGLFETAGDTVDEYAHETVGLRFGYLRRKVEIQRRPTMQLHSEVNGSNG